MGQRESEGQDTAQPEQQDSPAQTGPASSGAGIAGDPTVGSAGVGRLNWFLRMERGSGLRG